MMCTHALWIDARREMFAHAQEGSGRDFDTRPLGGSSIHHIGLLFPRAEELFFFLKMEVCFCGLVALLN